MISFHSLWDFWRGNPVSVSCWIIKLSKWVRFFLLKKSVFWGTLMVWWSREVPSVFSLCCTRRLTACVLITDLWNLIGSYDISWGPMLQHSKASVTIVADFSPEFNPPFHWRSKYQTKKMTDHINNLVPFEFPKRSNRSARSFTSTLICT